MKKDIFFKRGEHGIYKVNGGFEYPWAEEYSDLQAKAFWTHKDIDMDMDIDDWTTKLTEQDKNLVGNILKGFTQSEVLIADYWTKQVRTWFPKPEIALMCSTFGFFEGIHQQSYALLNDKLGLDDYSAFLDCPKTKAKLDSLIYKPMKSREDRARSLAIFSGFAEGVQLFSSFAILMSFQTRGVLQGVGQVVAYSTRDETQHSEAGCRLFREVIIENPELWTDDFKKSIYQSARDCVKLECDFIDKAFEAGSVPVNTTKNGKLKIIQLTPELMKNFIKHRADTKLGDLGLKPNWGGRSIDKDMLADMDWFEEIIVGTSRQDFFVRKPTEYSHANFDKSKIIKQAKLGSLKEYIERKNKQ